MVFAKIAFWLKFFKEPKLIHNIKGMYYEEIYTNFINTFCKFISYINFGKMDSDNR